MRTILMGGQSRKVTGGYWSHVGQNAKYSLRADVFCFASNIRHRSIGSAGPFGVDSGGPLHSVTNSLTTSVARLRPHLLTVDACFVVWRKIRRTAFSDFCNMG